MAWFTLLDGAAKRESRSAFIAMGSFWFGAVKFLFSGGTITAPYFTMTFAPLDAWLLAFFLVTGYGLYWGRRATDAWTVIKGGICAPQPPEKPNEPGA